MDMPEFFNSKKHVSRKERRCCECGGVILCGEQYYSFSGVWSGDFLTFKMCSDCKPLWDEWGERCKISGELQYFGGLFDDIFAGKHIDGMRKFIETIDKRCVCTPNWMRDELAEVEKKHEPNNQT